MNSCIETYSGRTFDPLNPNFVDVRIDDIAHALSNQCRFSGHTRVFYSVAEHCFRVSALLEKRGFSKSVQLWGLLHDASEAYLVDLPSPIKKTEGSTIGTAYRAVEDKLMAAICKRFSLPEKEPAAVKIADEDMLATEVRDLMHGDRPYWGKLQGKAQPGRIMPWGSEAIEKYYKDRYRMLTGLVI